MVARAKAMRARVARAARSLKRHYNEAKSKLAKAKDSKSSAESAQETACASGGDDDFGWWAQVTNKSTDCDAAKAKTQAAEK